MANEITRFHTLQDVHQGLQQMALATLTNAVGKEEAGRIAARFALGFRMAVQTAKKPEDLLACSRESFVAALAQSIDTGLVPGGHNAGCYILPKGSQLQWWINHRGLITLAAKAGQSVHARAVYPGTTHRYWDDDSGSHFAWEPTHPPEAETWPNLQMVYVVVRNGGGQIVAVERVSKRMIEERRAKSLQPNAGPWKDWPLEMALKTAIKYAASRGSITFGEGESIASIFAQEAAEERATIAPPAKSGAAALGISQVIQGRSEPIEEEGADDEIGRMESELEPARLQEIRTKLHIPAGDIPPGMVEGYRRALFAALPA